MRKPMFRRAAAPVHATEGAKADNSQPIEQTQTNAQENPNVNSQNENIEHKEPHEQIHQHMPVEGSADDKTNKKVNNFLYIFKYELFKTFEIFFYG